MRATSTVLGCDEGNMDLYTCESGAGPMIEWRQTHARVSLLQLQVIDKLLDTPWSYVYVYSMEDSLWSEAMHSSLPVVILGVYWHIFCCLFLLFLKNSFNMSLNQNKVIKSSFRIALSPFVHDENRKSEHLGGRLCILSGFWLPWQCDNSFDLFQAWDQWLWQTMLSKHKMHSWGPCGAYSCLFSAVRKWYRGDSVNLNKHNELKTSQSGPSNACKMVLIAFNEHEQPEKTLLYVLQTLIHQGFNY